MVRNVILSSLLCVLLFSCAAFGFKLTDELVEKYIVAYRNLRRKGIQMENVENITVQQGKQAFMEIDGIIKEAGFKDFAQFVMVNAKIGQAMSVLQSDAYMNKMDELTSPEFAEWNRILSDPDIPEENKKEVRAQLDAARKEFEKNKKMAEPMLKAVDMFTDKEALEVVKRHEKELLRLYQGR